MKNLIVCVCLLAGASITHGQTVDYTVLNKTHDLAPIKVALGPGCFDGSLTYPLTAGILVEGTIKDKLFYNFTWRRGYGQLHKGKVASTQNVATSMLMEAGVDFVLHDKDKTGSLKISTGSTGTSETYFHATVDKRVHWAASAGLVFRRIPRYVDHDHSIKSGDKTLVPVAETYYHFNATTTALYAGFTHRSIKKAKVSSDGWAYRRCIINKFYIHALVGATAVGQVQISGQNYSIDNKKNIPLGYRIGWEWDQHGTSTGFELGKMPTVDLNPALPGMAFSQFMNYARLTFHFWIYNSDVRYHLKTKK